MVCSPDAWVYTWLIDTQCYILSTFIQRIPSTYLKTKLTAKGHAWKCPGLSDSDMYCLTCACCCTHPAFIYLFIFIIYVYSLPIPCLGELNNTMHCYYPGIVFSKIPVAQAYGLEAKVVLCSQVYGRPHCQMQGYIWWSYWRPTQEFISQDISRLIHNK